MITFLIALLLTLLMILYLYRRARLHILEQVVVFLFVGIVFQMVIVFLASDLKLLKESRDVAWFGVLVFIRTVSVPLVVTIICNEIRPLSSRFAKGIVFLLGVLLLWGINEYLFRSHMIILHAGFQKWWVPVHWTLLLLLTLWLLRTFRARLAKEIRPLCPKNST